MDQAFTLGRRDETVAVRLTRKYLSPGGALLLPGERIAVTPLHAQQLVDEQFGVLDPATPSKSLDDPPHHKMLLKPGAKKG